ILHRHRCDHLIVEDGRVVGVSGTRLALSSNARGAPSNREAVGDFELRASAVVVASGGIGGDHELVRKFWLERLVTPPARMVACGVRAGAAVVDSGGFGGDHELSRKFGPERPGAPPAHMVTGVPAYVDGRMIDIAGEAGARLVNRDRMWHYTEGIRNWNPVWP